ncbi:unnamed protein product [Heterobilharzia americana]|nr:unnamed protein product [Heterobilharzia americana]
MDVKPLKVLYFHIIIQKTYPPNESETSFLSLTPNKFMHSTIIDDCRRKVESCITNTTSSIDLIIDVNRGTLMSHEAKCFTSDTDNLQATPTPTVSIQPSEKEENISSSQTLGCTVESNVQFNSIPENPNVLKWDYTRDLSSNHLDVSRIHSCCSHSCHPLNY